MQEMEIRVDYPGRLQRQQLYGTGMQTTAVETTGVELGSLISMGLDANIGYTSQ